MSHIPNSAVPHALPHEEEAAEGGGAIRDFARGVVRKVRATPKVAIAAGAAAVVGGIVAAALPKVRKATAAPKPRRTRKPKSGTAA